MAYLRNAWYVAAWDDEVTRNLFARTILDEPVLLFRKEDGAAVAISGRCPHRFAPLHLGKLIGDVVECPYHGLQFDCAGACVHNPHGSGAVPKTATLKTYPIREAHGVVWIWMGERQPDESLLPDFALLAQPEKYRTVRGVISVEANYELITDNLLDLTHIVYVHAGSIGSAQHLERQSTETKQEGSRVWSIRTNREITAGAIYHVFNPIYAQIKVDKLQSMRWDPPCNMLLEIVHHETQKPDRHRTSNYGGNLLTPESETRTHYFWSLSRDFDLENEKLDEVARGLIKLAFEQQDKPIIEAQQRMMGTPDLFSLRPVLLETDAATVRARRALDRLRRAELVPQAGRTEKVA